MRTRLLALAVALVLGITGTVVLVRYMQGADARALAGTRTVTVLMVRAPIPVGTPADELSDYVALTAVPELAAVGGRVADLSELAGMESVVPLVAGEQLLPHHFSAPGEGAAIAATVPDGFQQFTVMLQSQRALGGAIAAGDRVGMFLSFAPPLANHTTNLRLESVLVTSVRSASAVPGADSGDATTSADGSAELASAGTPESTPTAPAGVELYVTFATDAADAEVVIFAAEYGTIWLSEAPVGSGGSGARTVTTPDVYGTASSGGTP